MGDRVLKGQLLAHSQGLISAPIHAPTSGRIVKIGGYTAPHPSGLPVRTITLEPDGEDRWTELAGLADPFEADPDEIARRVAEAGIVGMGGATFPSAVKLGLRQRFPLTTLVINGAECEPYLTCDDRLMQERADAVVDGIRLMARALGVGRVLVAIENNKPAAQSAMAAVCAPFPGVEVVGVPTRYPMGSEKHLVQALTGLETPAQGLTASIGVVVHNVATAFAVHEAIREGRPLVQRVVTISGGAVREPRNLLVPLGTPVEYLLEQCGGLSEEPARLINGGPMMGQLFPSSRVPVVKGCNGILALTEAEVHPGDTMPCIRCGSCVEACPCGLVPLEMAAYARVDDLDGAVSFGLSDCISCGSCAFVCPSHIPLVQYFNYAKGELAERQRTKQKQEETRRLAAQKQERTERAAREKREALARRKAEMAAQKQAEGDEPEARAS